jgi:hypothetical protein
VTNNINTLLPSYAKHDCNTLLPSCAKHDGDTLLPSYAKHDGDTLLPSYAKHDGDTLLPSCAKHDCNTLLPSCAKHDCNTQTTRSAFINKASPQSNAPNLNNACSDIYLFMKLVEYTGYWNFSITCQLLFKSKKYVNYNLNRKYSQMYYYGKQTRNMILEKIFNPQKQLCLDLSSMITNISPDALGQVHTLNLEGCLITDVRPLKKVHTLNLSKCYYLSDVSPLIKVHTLNLSYCNQITDFSSLRNIHTLNLTGCYQITDFSVFENVHNLNLSKTEIMDMDVSVLRKVHTLDLSYCYNITNVGALTNIYSLNLTGCCQILDYTVLENVKILLLPYDVFGIS